jgi:Uma2 family endonuclease
MYPTPEEIRTAIERLSPAQRDYIATSILDLTREADGVRETAADYLEPAERRLLSVEEYLELEKASTVRHEYINGVVHAMAGASRQHELIVGNVFAAIHHHLRGGPCQSFVGNFKLRLEISRADILYYPDVMVACSPEGIEEYYLRNPRLIVEVLSPSTRSVDRREKLLNYIQVPTVEEYVLIAQDVHEITIHRRSEGWTPRWVVDAEAVAGLESIELSLPLAWVYEGILPGPSAAAGSP